MIDFVLRQKIDLIYFKIEKWLLDFNIFSPPNFNIFKGKNNVQFIYAKVLQQGQITLFYPPPGSTYSFGPD